MAAVPGALVQRWPRLQFKLVPREKSSTVYVQDSGSPLHRRRTQSHLYFPQVRQRGCGKFWDTEGPTSLWGGMTSWGLIPYFKGNLLTGKTSVRPRSWYCSLDGFPDTTPTALPVSEPLP